MLEELGISGIKRHFKPANQSSSSKAYFLISAGVDKGEGQLYF